MDRSGVENDVRSGEWDSGMETNDVGLETVTNDEGSRQGTVDSEV